MKIQLSLHENEAKIKESSRILYKINNNYNDSDLCDTDCCGNGMKETTNTDY